jgi:hypothetical protein
MQCQRSDMSRHHSNRDLQRRYLKVSSRAPSDDRAHQVVYSAGAPERAFRKAWAEETNGMRGAHARRTELAGARGWLPLLLRIEYGRIGMPLRLYHSYVGKDGSGVHRGPVRQQLVALPRETSEFPQRVLASMGDKLRTSRQQA